jgi:periplasmic protein TonB
MRYAFFAVIGSLIAGLLFLVMQGMVRIDPGIAIEPNKRTVPVNQWHREARDEGAQTRTRVRPEPPEVSERPDSIDTSESRNTREPELVEFDPPTFDNGIDIGPINERAASHRTGEAIAVVMIEPQWPREALLRGIEGWVKMEFTIRPDGSVGDIRVIEAEPRRMFEQHAVRALERWRFQARVVDGRAVSQRATQVIEFRFQD